MPIYQLMDHIPVFPSPEEAERDGLLAIGGDLSPERLLVAYQQGIFPWYEEGQPLLWWSPDPRLIMEPKNFKLSRSLKKVIRKGQFQVRTDTSFSEVIRACATIRTENDQGTWITMDMEEAYIRLHELGYAHSVETWYDGELVGGLYGIFLGRAFFGESMFMRKTDASKVAFAALVEQMKKWKVDLIDCQVTSNHLKSLGAVEIPRLEFLKRLKQAISFKTIPQKWAFGSPMPN